MSSRRLAKFVKENAHRLAGLALVPSLLACGCESMSNGEKGALAGGGIGAGTGAIIGSATHHTRGGAVIGGADRALAGRLTGHTLDACARKQQTQISRANT